MKKAKQKLYIRRGWYPNGRYKYWVTSAIPEAAKLFAPCVYFREGRATLFADDPTWFTSLKAARAAIVAAGFEVAEAGK